MREQGNAVVDSQSKDDEVHENFTTSLGFKRRTSRSIVCDSAGVRKPVPDNEIHIKFLRQAKARFHYYRSKMKSYGASARTCVVHRK